MRRYDGYTPMNGVDGAQVTGRYPAYSKAASSEGVVVARYACDDEGNVSKKYTEYDVKELRTGQVFRNCRRTAESGGVDSGDDTPLRPAQKSAEQGTLNNGTFDPLQSPLLSSDGDHVMLAFLQGSQDSAVISGVIPHSKSAYANTKADGDRKFSIHKGTLVETKDDGTHVIKRYITPVAPGQPHRDEDNVSTVIIRPNGDIELDHVSGASLHMLEDGTLRVDGVATDGIRLGFGATEHVIKGDAHKTTFDALVASHNALKAKYEAHFHQDHTTAPTTGPVDVAPTLVTPALSIPPAFVLPPFDIFSPSPPQAGSADADDMPTSDLSDKVVTE